MTLLQHTQTSVLVLRAQIEAEYQRDLMCAPRHLTVAREGLTRRIGFGSDAAAEWPRRFTPMVLLYPSLQAEAFPPIALGAAQRATLAHVYFLIFSVLDDRRRDGQIVLTPAELEFTAWLFERGLEILGEFVPEPELEQIAASVLERYERGHVKLNRLGAGEGVPQKQMSAIVVGRSYWGVLATQGLFQACPEMRPDVIRAFESLVWGIQWVDDIEDWRDDLMTQDDNLMMLAMDPQSLQVAAAAPPEMRRGIVAKTILEQGAISHATSQARIAFDAAATAQEQLGCRTMAELIRERAGALAGIEREAIRQCEEDVLVMELARMIAPGKI